MRPAPTGDKSDLADSLPPQPLKPCELVAACMTVCCIIP
jgi:hypothetical protein